MSCIAIICMLSATPTASSMDLSTADATPAIIPITSKNIKDVAPKTNENFNWAVGF